MIECTQTTSITEQLIYGDRSTAIKTAKIWCNMRLKNVRTMMQIARFSPVTRTSFSQKNTIVSGPSSHPLGISKRSFGRRTDGVYGVALKTKNP